MSYVGGLRCIPAAAGQFAPDPSKSILYLNSVFVATIICNLHQDSTNAANSLVILFRKMMILRMEV